MSSNSEVKSIIDRILRLKAEQDDLGSDIRDIYLEAKSRGFNKTALGNAVTAIRKREKNREAFETNDADTDLYLSVYFGSGTDVATHAHAPEAEPPRDPDTGELDESASDEREAVPPIAPSSSAGHDAEESPAPSISMSARLVDPDGFMTEDVPEHLRRRA